MRHKFLDRLRPLPIIFSLLAIVSITIGQDAPIIQSNSRQFAKAPYIPGNKRPIGDLGPQTMGDYDRFRRELLYPHTPADFTDITSTKSMRDQPLQFHIPFFGFRYTYIWIHKDGYLAFNVGQLSYKFPVKFPIPPEIATNKGQDPSMLAPFFAIQDIPQNVPGAGIYLRVIELAKENNETLRNGIYADFREGMIGAADFHPKFAVIITWKNMTYANKAPDFDLKTNTYQVVLATDEMRTYAMINYDLVEWNSGFFEGTKGPSAYVGFNAGNSTRTFEFVPYSQNPRVSLLPSLGYGNGLNGRFFFQVDEEIWPGSCIEKDLDPNLRDRLPLTFFPRVGNMLGGTVVNFTGPCLHPKAVIICTFENFHTKGIYRDRNHASCVTPPVMYHGYVDLTIRVDDRTYFYGRFYIQPPDIANDDVIIVNNADREEEPIEMELKWKPEKLAWNFGLSAQISLWGYRESNDVYPQLTYIDTLVDSVPLSQAKMTLDLTQFRTRNNIDTTDILFGFISMNLTNPKALGDFVRSPTIWSRPMPLAWYFKTQWEREYGTNNRWKQYFCQNWFTRESYSDYFATTLFRCPCHLNQAYLDVGRFSPDLECNVIDRKCETFHNGALHCVRTGRPSIGGSGQTCCYDDYGELLQTADTMYGGRPSRSFVYGKHPFKMQMMIPLLSEYLHDVVPFFFCCKWQEKQDNSDTCKMYNYWRTSQDCSSYQSPGIASIFGDPHLVTFDRTNYTFNGKGEFTLVHVDNAMHKFELQGRFEQMPQPDANTILNATVLKAIAAAENTSSTVEFRIRPIAASWRYQMYVIVDKEYVYWWDESMRLQNFRGVTLYQPAGIQNMSHVIAMFDSGAGVEVVANRGHMSVHVYAPYTFVNNTRGLLGNYSKQTWDDFTMPNGNMLPINTPPDMLHREMVRNYRVLDKVMPTDINQVASLFFHDSVSYTYYDDPNFLPMIRPQFPPYALHLREDMLRLCSDSVACQYDFITTLDADYAKVTKEEETHSIQLVNDAQVKYIRCPALPKPTNGRKSENRYWPGTLVRFSCNDGYRLTGYETRRCREDGLWSWGVEAECISDIKYYGSVAGIGFGILIPIIVLLLLILLMVFMSRDRQQADYITYETGDPGKLDEAKELNPSEKSDNRSDKGSNI